MVFVPMTNRHIDDDRQTKPITLSLHPSCMHMDNDGTVLQHGGGGGGGLLVHITHAFKSN